MTPVVRVSDSFYEKVKPLMDQGLSQPEAFDRFLDENQINQSGVLQKCVWLPDVKCPIGHLTNNISTTLKGCELCPLLAERRSRITTTPKQ